MISFKEKLIIVLIIIIFILLILYLLYFKNNIELKNTNVNNKKNIESFFESTPNYLGCFKDSSDRAIKKFLAPSGNTVETCSKLANISNYNTFSLQFKGECWADNNPLYSQYGSAENCEPLGGGYTNQVYTTNIKSSIPVLPNFFTISDSSGNTMKYDKTNNCIRLKAPESDTIILIKFSIHNVPSVYNNVLGRIALQNNNVNPPTYIRHSNFFLQSNNFESNNDFAWGFIKDEGINNTYKITNDYNINTNTDKNYYIGYDSSSDKVKILPNNNKPESLMQSWTIKEFIQPTTTNYLSNVLQDSNSKINTVRFKTLDNQDRLNSISERINKIKLDLANLNTSNSTSSNTFTFY